MLARQARVPEASNGSTRRCAGALGRELRVAFIDQLVDEQRYAEAIAQYAELDKADPGNPDYLRNWGKLLLRDTSRPKAEHQADAEKVWRRIVVTRQDPLIAAQVADLFRYADMTDQALEQYQRAVELAPAAPQYREYLGEYYHILKRPDEAFPPGEKLAEAPPPTAANITRLAEVLAQFGFFEQALPEIAEACQLDPKDFSLQLKAAGLQFRGEKIDDALASLDRAEKLAQNDEERETILLQQIKAYILGDQLAKQIESLQTKIQDGKPSAHDWYLLARYLEEQARAAGSHRRDSTRGRAGTQLDSRVKRRGAIAEQSGELEQASALQAQTGDRRPPWPDRPPAPRGRVRIADRPRRRRPGRRTRADRGRAGQRRHAPVLRRSCFRLGKPDEALTTLRRAVRANPSDQNILLALGSALAGQFRTDEAIEPLLAGFRPRNLAGRQVGRGRQVDRAVSANQPLRPAARTAGRNRQEAEAHRELTICLAQAHQSAGDYGMARQGLERLLNENSRDTQLLQQLSKLAEAEADLASAISFQEQVAKVAPGPEAEFRLAMLLSRTGRSQEAAEILVRLAAKEEDKEKLLRNIDGLLGPRSSKPRSTSSSPSCRKPQGLGADLSRGAGSIRAKTPRGCRPLPGHPGPGYFRRRARSRGQQRMASRQKAASPQFNTVDLPFVRMGPAYEVQRAVGITTDNYSIPSGRASLWTPQRFSQARMAALGWLYRIAQQAGGADEFVANRKTEAEKADSSERVMWDWAYLESVRGANQQDLLPIAKRLASGGQLAAQYLYLTQLPRAIRA